MKCLGLFGSVSSLICCGQAATTKLLVCSLLLCLSMVMFWVGIIHELTFWIIIGLAVCISVSCILKISAVWPFWHDLGFPSYFWFIGYCASVLDTYRWRLLPILSVVASLFLHIFPYFALLNNMFAIQSPDGWLMLIFPWLYTWGDMALPLPSFLIAGKSFYSSFLLEISRSSHPSSMLTSWPFPCEASLLGGGKGYPAHLPVTHSVCLSPMEEGITLRDNITH